MNPKAATLLTMTIVISALVAVFAMNYDPFANTQEVFDTAGTDTESDVEWEAMVSD